MYKIFLSYGHGDAARAEMIRQRLTGLGQTVWMDESRDDLRAAGSGAPSASGSFIGIPTGGRHRDVIEAAIEASASFVICDSPDWRESAYCRDELKMARAAGCRVAVITWPGLMPLDVPGTHVDDARLDDLVQVLEGRVEVALARVRLDAERRRPALRRTWIADLFSEPGRVRDAGQLLATPPAPDAPELPPALRLFAEAVLAEARRRGRRVRRLVTAILAVLTALAVAAVIGGAIAVRDDARAKASQRTASSLEAAAQSLDATQPRAGSLAQQAWLLDHNAASRSAMAVSNAALAQQSIVTIPTLGAPAQVVGFDGGVAIVNGTHVHMVDELGHETTVVALGEPSGKGPLAVFGRSFAVLSNAQSGRRALEVGALGGGPVTNSALNGVTAISGGLGAQLWVATGSGGAGIYDPERDVVDQRLSVHGPISALAVTASEVVVLYGDSHVAGFSLEGSRTPRLWDVDLSGVAPATVSASAAPDRVTNASTFTGDRGSKRDSQRDRITICGGSVHVVLGRTLAGFADSVHVALDLAGAVTDGFTRHSSQSFACQSGGDLVGAGMFATRLDVFRGGQTAPNGMITDEDRFGTTAVGNSADGGLIVVNARGSLLRATASSPLDRPSGTTSFVAPLADGSLLAQDLMGVLWRLPRLGRAVSVGHLAAPLQWSVTAGDVTVGVSGVGVYQLSEKGVSGHWAFPGLRSASLTPDGRELIIADQSRIIVQPLAAGARATYWPIPRLEPGETVADLAMVDGDLGVETTHGRIVLASPSGRIDATFSVPHGDVSMIRNRPDGRGGLVVVSSDGVIRLLDHALRVESARYLGAVGRSLLVSARSNRIAVPMQNQQMDVLDGSTLELLQVEHLDSQLINELLLSADGQSLIQARYYSRTVQSASSGYSTFIDMLALRAQSGSAHAYPAVPANQDEQEAQVTQIPLCEACAPT